MSTELRLRNPSRGPLSKDWEAESSWGLSTHMSGSMELSARTPKVTSLCDLNMMAGFQKRELRESREQTHVNQVEVMPSTTQPATFTCSLGWRSHKVPPRFKGRGNRLHIFVGIGKVLQNHAELEVLWWLFLENITSRASVTLPSHQSGEGASSPGGPYPSVWLC